MVFDHEKLDVYKVSLEFSKFVGLFVNDIPGNHRHIRDQLARASLSIPLNIAEGNGKRSPLERKRIFEIARGSAMECAALMDVIVMYGFLTQDKAENGKTLLVRIISMLSKMTEKADGMVRENIAPYGSTDLSHDAE